MVSYALVGGRQIGKSSILVQLFQSRLHHRYHPWLYQCQRLPNAAPTYQQFLEDITRKWLPDMCDFTPTLFRDIVARLSNDKPLVLMIDEVDRLIVVDQQVGWPLFGELRALSESRQCQFVFAGERLLREAVKNGKSPLFNFVKVMLIRPLDQPDVKELITYGMRLLKISLADEAAIVQHIWDATGGHPNVVQNLCERLLKCLDERRDRRLLPKDVIAVTHDPDFQQEELYAVYMEQATILERMLPLALAEKAKRPYTLREVCHHLEERLHLSTTQRGKPRAMEVEAALHRLIDLRSIFEYTREGYVFSNNVFHQVADRWGKVTLEDELFILTEKYEVYGDLTEDEISQRRNHR